MDKNNDIQVNKVNKWDYGVVDMSLWHLKDEFDALVDKLNGVYGIDVFEIEELTKDTHSSMDKVLERFNELEAVHQKECGMISQYEEENRNLKSELDIKTDECDCLISRVFKQDEEYTRLKEENEELRETRELLNKVNSKQCAEVDDLEADIKDLEVQVRVNKGIASIYESEIKQVTGLAKFYGLIIYDDRKDAIPDDVVSIGMCGHYYVLGSDLKNENDRLRNRCNELAVRAGKYSWAIKIMLKKASFSPDHIAEELKFMAKESTTPKDVAERWDGYANELFGGRDKEEKEDTLKKMVQEVTELEKEKFDLENQLVRQKQETGVMISHYEGANRSLRNQWKKLKNPHIKLTGDNGYLRKERDRHIDLLDKLRWALEDKGIYCEWNEAALKWNLRDTANICESCKQHFEEELRIRCKEIDDKNKLIEELTHENRVFRLKNLINRTYGLTGQIELLNKEINGKNNMIDGLKYDVEALTEKIQTLEKENEDLRTTLKMCERDANVSRRLCHNIAFNAERARNKTHWFK